MTEYKAIEKCQRPAAFMAITHGAPYNGEWYAFLGQHRESSILDKANFTEGLRELGGTSETVMVVQESCSLVGWLQWIAIHESDKAALAEADEILCALSDYPVLDDIQYSDMVTEAIEEYWQGESVKCRAQLCLDAEYTIMGARHEYPPMQVLEHIHDIGAFA